MIKKKIKAMALIQPFPCPIPLFTGGRGGGVGGLFQVREVCISQTPDVKARAQTDFCLRLQKLKPVFYHNYL